MIDQAYTSVAMASSARSAINTVMPHVLHNNPANTGATTAPASSPILIQLMVRARLRLSKLEMCAMSAPQAGRKAALPMSSAVFAMPTPRNVGAIT